MQVKFIPEQDMRVMDALWRAASGNKFGYSVQKEIWVQNRCYWERLFRVIDWTHGEHNFYRSGCDPESASAACTSGNSLLPCHAGHLCKG